MVPNSFIRKLLRLPHGFLCYAPPLDSPPVSSLPAHAAGHVTFGSFNNLAKISNEVIASWCAILQRVPKSRRKLKARGLQSDYNRHRVLQLFQNGGISAERIEILEYAKGPVEHLAIYQQIDIALDSFPYNGTATTCESLWMGVPLISFAGTTHVGQWAPASSTPLGFRTSAPASVDGYVDLAVELASNLDSLSLRQSMRARLINSGFTDEKKFTKGLEETYRQIWTTWSEEPSQMSKKMEFVPIQNDVLVAVTPSLNHLTPYVLKEQGDWFEDEIKFVRRLIRPGMRVVDVGANHGVYALSMAKIVGDKGKVWAIEPDAEAMSYLQKSVEKNRFDNTTLVAAGLSDKTGVTLDGCMTEYGMTQIDFLKINAGGNELKIFEAAKQFLKTEIP